MSKQAGWVGREENAFIRVERQRAVVAIARAGLGRKVVKTDTERKKLRKSRLELTAGQGERAAYRTVRYGTWLASLILLLSHS